MSLPLHALFNETAQLYKLTLLCGQQGLDKEITWLQFTEDISTTTFFRGNELIITTGLCANNTGWLYDFITELINRNTCGLIINTGKYIYPEDITPEICELCKKANFPLIIMPWEIHLADIMQDYYNRLFSAAQTENSLIEMLRITIAAPKKADLYAAELSHHHLSQQPYLLNLLEADQPYEEKTATALLLSCKAWLNKYNTSYLLFWHNSHLLLFFFANKLPNNLLDGLENSSSAKLYCGSSNLTLSLSSVNQAFHEAAAALAIAKLQQNPQLAFSQLGPYRLLFATNDTALLHTMHDELLSPLLAYEQQHTTPLYQTLRLYLLNNCSLQQTADLLFTHRNTISYRITKIKELLHCSLDDSTTRFNLLLAYYIADYLRLSNSPAQA